MGPAACGLRGRLAAGQTWRARWRVRVLRAAADGTRVTVSHDNQSTKGALARFVLERSPVSGRLARLGGTRGLPGRPRVLDVGRGGGVADLVRTDR